jgi:hypothetical protein
LVALKGTFWCRIIQNPFDSHADFGDAGPSPASWLVDDKRIVATHLNAIDLTHTRADRN